VRIPNQSPISASRPLKALTIADVSESSTWASCVERPPVSCEASWALLVDIGAIHFSHVPMNSESTTSHTSRAHETTWRMTCPVVSLKSGRR